MRSVLDSSAFFTAATFEGELYTTSSVISELRDLPSKARSDLLREAGLQVMDPDRESVSRVRENAVARGEAGVLSPTDIGVLALALQLRACIMSDDYALQNVARSLSIQVIPIQQKGARNIRWKFRCSGCGRYYREPGECQICGALIQRKLK
jgi:endoribonuclease Nob1